MNQEAVLDRETGLVWERAPSTFPPLSWLHAHDHCIQRTVGNRQGWRLPTVQELSSLVEPPPSPRQFDPTAPPPDPTLPSGHPFTRSTLDHLTPLTPGVLATFYWSANTAAGNSINAWGVDFFAGQPMALWKANILFAWCVRGGQGVAPQ